MRFLKNLTNLIFKSFGFKISKYQYFIYNQKLIQKNYFIKYLELSKNNKRNILNYALDSKSEYAQDLFFLDQVNFKKEGFFVEFGAGDGEFASNTYLLEKHFNYKGILCEPCKFFHQELKKNRSCFLSHKAVAEISNLKLNFVENINPYYSKISDKKTGYQVETISLIDLLNQYNAPTNFEFLSIDTEGNEYEIIKSFDFDQFTPKVILIEYNNNKKQKKLITDLVTKNGYLTIAENESDQDLWFVRKI